MAGRSIAVSRTGFTRRPPRSTAPKPHALKPCMPRSSACKGRIDYRPRHLAWNDRRWASASRLRRESQAPCRYDALIIASGATDRLMPVKGWDHAGTYSLGAAQIALKAQACVHRPARRLPWHGAAAPARCRTICQGGRGCRRAARYDRRSRRRLKALPQLLARPDCAPQGYEARGRAEAVRHRHSSRRDAGRNSWRGGNGRVRRYRAARHGRNPPLRLRRRRRLAFICGPRRSWPISRAATSSSIRQRGNSGRRSTPTAAARTTGVYLAGDGARTQGADGAEISGRLAAFAALADLGPADAPVDVSGAADSTRREWSASA